MLVLLPAIGEVMKVDKMLLISNTATALPKLRDREVVPALSSRSGGRFGKLIREREPVSFDSRCRLTVNNPRWNARFTQTYSVPPLSLRQYQNATCAPGQIAVKDGRDPT